jgi:hypothetical protein
VPVYVIRLGKGTKVGYWKLHPAVFGRPGVPCFATARRIRSQTCPRRPVLPRNRVWKPCIRFRISEGQRAATNVTSGELCFSSKVFKAVLLRSREKRYWRTHGTAQ